MKDELSGTAIAAVTKQRDLDGGVEFAFKLEQVVVGSDRRGKAITSCVVVSVDDAPRPSRITLTPKEKLALDQLRNALIDHGGTRAGQRNIPSSVPVVPLDRWRERLVSADIVDGTNRDTGRRQWNRLKDALQNKGIIRVWEGLVWLAGQPGQERDEAGTNEIAEMEARQGSGQDGGTPPLGGSPLSRPALGYCPAPKRDETQTQPAPNGGVGE